MMNSRLLLAVFATAPLGCAMALQPPVATVGPQNPVPASATSVAGPFVQAGAVFSVKMDQPIDTYFSAQGAPFTATVVSPLVDSSGQLVVPYGAKLRGTISSVGTDELPNVRFALQSIDTVRGPVPVEAAVREAQYYEWAGPDPLIVEAAPRLPYATARQGSGLGTASANLFGYQSAYGYGTTQPREVRIPTGAILELALVAPLAMP